MHLSLDILGKNEDHSTKIYPPIWYLVCWCTVVKYMCQQEVVIGILYQNSLLRDCESVYFLTVNDELWIPMNPCASLVRVFLLEHLSSWSLSKCISPLSSESWYWSLAPCPLNWCEVMTGPLTKRNKERGWSTRRMLLAHMHAGASVHATQPTPWASTGEIDVSKCLWWGVCISCILWNVGKLLFFLLSVCQLDCLRFCGSNKRFQ